MTLKTNLNRSPYFADYNPNKDYYHIAFQPGVSVQARELNNLQLQLQKQIERFGDSIFQSGTIVSGVNFQFMNPLPYIKIRDLDFDGKTAVPFSYVNYNLINPTTQLIAQVVNYVDGFEASDPNLKTLYLNYQNTGNVSSNTLAFVAGDLLTAYDPVLNGIESINVINGGVGFSNTDQLLAISPLAISVTSGTLTVGDYLLNLQGANVQIVSVDANTYASSNLSIVVVQPRAVDLANSAANNSNWTISLGQSVTNPGSTLAGIVKRTIGTGFIGRIVTDGVGTIQNAKVLNKGVKYTPTAPYITVRSIGNVGGYSTLNLTARNYFAKLVVASNPSSVGNGYGFTITEGVVYQEGYFLRVVPQMIVVSKYDQNPDNVAVGFTTNEQVVNYNIDSTLLDNVNNTENAQAPGADRVQLIPVLTLANSSQAAANSNFLTIAEWKEGRPFKQNQSTIYSTIGDEMAVRTNDAAGSFVIDPFLVTTRSPIANTANQEGEFFNVVIDPGKAYINGYRVTTTSNFNIDDEKGTDTLIVNNHVISLNYGNFIIVNNVAGTFQFNIGDVVQLYDTARGFLTPSLITAQTLTPPGSIIGTANIRSLMPIAGDPGISGSTFRLYLFNLTMNTGKNFGDVKSVFYNGPGVIDGVADIVLVKDPQTSNNICIMNDTAEDQLTFNIGVDTLMNANNVTYLYRTINAAATISNGNASNATLVVDISSNPNEFFPYTGALSSVQTTDLYVVPTSGEMVAVTAGTGTVVGNTATANVIGTSTTFLSDYVAGDWIYISANASGGADLHQIQTIVNNTFLTINSNNAFINTVAVIFRAFPQNVPVPFGPNHPRLTANVNVSQNILTIDFGRAFSFAGSRTASVAYNVSRSNPTQLTKNPNRNRFVLICLANNAGGTSGPWCIGVPDVFRLRGVYVGNSSVSNTSPNQIKNFYIDHNQNADFYNLSWLSTIAQPSVALNSSQYLLVQFDYFTVSGGPGFYDTVSYTQSSNLQQIFLQDSQPLSNLASVVNSFEVPEIFTDVGTEIDLLNQIDFRPYAANTVAPSTVYSTAPLNPANTVTLSTTGEKKFPLPNSLFVCNIQFYIGRIDTIVVNKNASFSIVSGPPSQFAFNQSLSSVPDSTLKITDIVVPPYPNLPTWYSPTLNEILTTNVINQKYLTTRISHKTIHLPTSNNVLPYNQPKVYTMEDIGNLERRIADVEYEVALSAMEAGVSHKFIPSSIDPTQDRFKFGFFVDDFTTSTYSDLRNPQYWALKENVDIVPPKMTWDASLPGGTPTWIDSVIFSQDIATLGTIDDPLGLGPICALNLANTVAYKQLFKNATDVLKSSNPSAVTDVVNLTFASSTTIFDTVNYIDTPLNDWLQTHQYDAYNINLQYSPLFQQLYGLSGINISSSDLSALEAAVQQYQAVLQSVHPGDPGTIGASAAGVDYQSVDIVTFIQQLISNIQLTQATKPAGGTFIDTVYYPPVVLYFYNYDMPNLIQIFQNNNLIIDTNSAQNLTADDINLLTGPGGQQWFNDDTQFFLKNFTEIGGGFAEYAGKLTFNYNPANGNQFTIKATSPQSVRWRYVIAYPIDGASVGCVPPTTIYNIQPTFTAQYTQIAAVSWCGNGGQNGAGAVNVLTGFTETWNPFTPPQATTSVVPFNVNADWHRGTQIGQTFNYHY